MQSATQVGFGLREARLDVAATRLHSSTAEPSVSLGKNELLLARVMTLAAIQMDTDQCLGVDTETDSTLGETGQVIELEAFSGFSLSDLRRPSRLSLLKYMVRELTEALLSSRKPAAPACCAKTPTATARPRWTCSLFRSYRF